MDAKTLAYEVARRYFLSRQNVLLRLALGGKIPLATAAVLCIWENLQLKCLNVNNSHCLYNVKLSWIDKGHLDIIY